MTPDDWATLAVVSGAVVLMLAGRWALLRRVRCVCGARYAWRHHH